MESKVWSWKKIMGPFAAILIGGASGFVGGAIVTFSSLNSFGAIPGFVGGVLAAVAVNLKPKSSLLKTSLIALLAGMVFGILGGWPLLYLMVKLGGAGP
jgi:ABC-type xylose transport system permease subunit